MMAFMAALMASYALLRTLHPLAARFGLLDHPTERRKQHRQPTPLVGGIAIFLALLLALLLTVQIDHRLAFGLGGAAVLVVVGGLDDRHGLGWKPRMLAQVVAALLLTLGAGVQLTSLGDLFGLGPLALGVFAVPFTVFATVGLINAFNMIDGIDGLAGGVALIALLALLPLSSGTGTEVVLLPAIAAIVPYLLCNLGLFGCRRYKLFLGDAGSLLLGYLVTWMLIGAVQAPIGSVQAPSALEPAAAIWLIAIPLLDALGVIAKRLLKRRSPFGADRGHLHHQLSRVFGSTQRALVVLLSAAALFAGIGLVGQALGVAPAVLLGMALGIFLVHLAAQPLAPRAYRRLMRRRRAACSPMAVQQPEPVLQ
ncbi:undecaprenyl-phosphate alpha-N-acetylglucosaminyl 1-phosphate transferase [Thiohalocapsa marina]|nr:undecaprenyl-phosphate alpha-N-acetylglucosaminyl 1-phosphate transferase [Thiohalocapsa marina]